MGWWLAAGMVTLLLMGLVAWAMRIAARRRLYGSLYGLRSDAVGDWGLSILLAQGADEGQVAALLTADYERCEVVVAMDGAREAPLLQLLQARYRLIRVDCRAIGELPAAPITALYRSRSRLFRRLVVVDVRSGNRAERLHAAAEMAAYELLMPLSRGCCLREGAVAWLVAEADRAVKHPAEVWVLCAARPVTCYRRSVVVRVGGFGQTWRLRRRWLPAGVVRCMQPEQEGIRRWRWLWWIACLGGIGAVGSDAGWLTSIAAAGTFLAWWMLLQRLNRVVDFEPESHDWSFCRALREKSEAGV